MKIFRLYGVQILILCIAVILRFYNLNWDDNFHLHPDERFLTMVGNAMKVPESFSDYINPAVSTFSPININFKFFVYGIFPLSLAKLLSIELGLDNYNDFTVFGRFLSAFFSVLTVIILYRLISLLWSKLHKRTTIEVEDRNMGLAAALLLSLNPFSIQQAHFFTVESFLVFFTTLSLYLSIKALYSSFNKAIGYLVLSSITLGVGVACKVTALLFFPFVFVMVGLVFLFRHKNKKNNHKILMADIGLSLGFMIVLFIISYITFRFIQPFYFADSNFLNPSLNEQTIANFKSLKDLDTPDTSFPPAVQWQTKQSILWPYGQLFFWGLNPVVTLISFSTIFLLLLSYTRQFISVVLSRQFNKFQEFVYEKGSILLIVGFTLVFFIYQGVQFTMNMRYFYPLYPFFIGLVPIGLSLFIPDLRWKRIMFWIVMIVSLGWSCAFMSIYILPHSRVTASYWIYEHLPKGSKIAVEHWDDGLPLSFLDHPNSQYSYIEVPIFIPDTKEKWQELKKILTSADYYIMSSNRAWGSNPTYPKVYPQSKEFYDKVFSGKLGLQEVARFHSRPRFLGIEINDDNSEESFTVYDHPVVIILKVEDKEKLIRELDILSRNAR